MPGHVIRKYREMRNFSQKYVAAKMGISQNSYSKIENNITQLTVHHVKELSKILDVPITDLLNDDFEIHRPLSIPHSVSKAELLRHLEELRLKVESKHAHRHHSYIVALSLMIAAESSIANTH